MKKLVLTGIICAALAGCEVAPPSGAVSGQRMTGDTRGDGISLTEVANARVPAPSAAAADAFAVAYLETMQARSFRNRSEYCGYFFVDAAGTLQASPPTRGNIDSCPRTPPPAGVFAAWHTHGAYDDAYDNEVPSPPDMIGTFQSGFDGYLSTPGGRVWRIDVATETAYQICPQACVSVDPGFVPENEAGIRLTYTVETLFARFGIAAVPQRLLASN